MGSRRRGAVQQELGEQADAVAGGTGRYIRPLLLRHRHAGNVQVRPVVVGKLLQEDGGGADATHAAATIFHVGDRCVDCLAVILVKRQAPEPFVDVGAGGD